MSSPIKIIDTVVHMLSPSRRGRDNNDEGSILMSQKITCCYGDLCNGPNLKLELIKDC